MGVKTSQLPIAPYISEKAMLILVQDDVTYRVSFKKLAEALRQMEKQQ